MTSGGGLFGGVAAGNLADARLRLHHAALLTSAVGRALAPKERGYRHAALFWDARARALVGAPIGAGPAGAAGVGRLRAELRFDPPILALADPDRSEPALAAWSTPLADLTFDDAWRGLVDAVRAAGLATDKLVPRLPSDLPEHPLQQGAPFSVDPAFGDAVGRWFGFADGLLANVARAHESPLPVACWGDHFDLAVFVPLPIDVSVTVGFSPGDGSIPEPYFYVLPYPTANPGRLPGAPANARWQTKGWVGLALTGSTIAAAADPVAMGRAFLAEGFDIASEVVLTPP